MLNVQLLYIEPNVWLLNCSDLASAVSARCSKNFYFVTGSSFCMHGGQFRKDESCSQSYASSVLHAASFSRKGVGGSNILDTLFSMAVEGCL